MRAATILSATGLLAAAIVNAIPVPHSRSHVAKDNTPKLVFAHHIVGNTFPYTIDDWAADISLAQQNGIDGFALNIGPDAFQVDRVTDAFQAAQNANSGFKLFFSFDMSVLPCNTPDGATTLRNFITTFSTHPNQFTVNGKVFASTFAGESCQFGQDTVADGWRSQFTQHPDLTGQNAVFFVPSFFVDPSTFPTFTGVMDGDYNFNSGWPVDLHTAQATQVVSAVGDNLDKLGAAGDAALSKFIGAFDTDTQHITDLASMNDGAKTYMAAVTPWFFTHFSPQTFNKNFIFYTDDHLYPTRWQTLIDNRDSVDFVEINTWNDYGESHYIGPIKGALPTGSEAWVNGFDHTAFLDMTNYFATAFKTGSAPAITQDKIYLWARPHPKDADSPDPVGKPTDFILTQDTLWALVFATSDATVTLATSNTTSQTFNVTAGVNKLSLPLTPGGFIQGTLQRGGQTVVDVKPDNFTFNPTPPAFNYNTFAVVSQ